MKIIVLTILALTASCGEELNEEDKTSGYALALDSKDDLPDCTLENEQQLILVKKTKTFYSCEDESWTKLHKIEEKEIAHETKDLSEEAEVDKTKNSPSIQTSKEEAGKNCSAGGIKVIIGEETQYVCNGIAGKDGKDGIDGKHGSAGSAGANGLNGNDGSNGTNGVNGQNGTSTKVFDANDNHIGYLVDYANYMVMLKDGKMAQIRYKDGDFSGAKAYNTATLTNAFCHYESNDCTGTCYLNDSSNTITETMKDWIVEGNNVYYLTTGSEAATGSKTMLSRMVMGSCQAGSWANSNSIPLNTTWQNTEGIDLPIAAPLSFGE